MRISANPGINCTCIIVTNSPDAFTDETFNTFTAGKQIVASGERVASDDVYPIYFISHVGSTTGPLAVMHAINPSGEEDITQISSFGYFYDDVYEV